MGRGLDQLWPLPLEILSERKVGKRSRMFLWLARKKETLREGDMKVGEREGVRAGEGERER